MNCSTKTISFLILLLICLPVAKANPDNTNERLAAQYLREGQYEQALSLYQELFAENPTPVIYNNYLETLFALEQFRQAERVVNARIEAHPERVAYRVDLAWVHHRADNQRRARRMMDDLIATLPAAYQEVVDLAVAFDRRGFTDRALETYQHGRQMLGDRHPLHLRIAPIHERQGRYTAMMEEYIDYLDEQHDDAERVRGLLQDAISNDPGFDRNDALRTVLLRRTQASPDNVLYSEMLLWLSIQQQDFRMAFMQARALDRRLQQGGKPVLEVAGLSTSNQDYTIAAQAYQYLLDMGEDGAHYLEALVGYLNVRFLSVVSDYVYETEQLLEIEQEYKEALHRLGVNSRTVQLVRNLANLQAFHLDNTGGAIDLLQSTLDLPNISNRVKGECRIELADILLLTGEVWDATLLYSQVDRMFRDDPLAHEAKYKNARLTYFIGEFDWAKAQLDVLKAGTSRLIANDAMRLSLRIQDNVGMDGHTEPLLMFARAEQRIFMNHLQEAMQTLDSISVRFPNHQISDDVLFARSEIMRQKGQYAAADSLLAEIVEQYPMGLLADEALMQRARLHEELFEKTDKAMALYQQLIVDYPASVHTIHARNRFRALRGDMVN